MTKILILQGGFNEEHNVSLNTSKEIAKVLKKLKRESSQPIKEKTSGSTFKNPSGKYAAVLIEQAGCKGMKNGGASVSSIHSNFIINNGEATALDIENLGKKIIKKVKEKFGITLEWEIKIIGK